MSIWADDQLYKGYCAHMAFQFGKPGHSVVLQEIKIKLPNDLTDSILVL